jgi:hypothetical protein
VLELEASSEKGSNESDIATDSEVHALRTGTRLVLIETDGVLSERGSCGALHEGSGEFGTRERWGKYVLRCTISSDHDGDE